MTLFSHVTKLPNQEIAKFNSRQTIDIQHFGGKPQTQDDSDSSNDSSPSFPILKLFQISQNRPQCIFP